MRPVCLAAVKEVGLFIPSLSNHFICESGGIAEKYPAIGLNLQQVLRYYRSLALPHCVLDSAKESHEYPRWWLVAPNA
jgi:hypothetical protein